MKALFLFISAFLPLSSVGLVDTRSAGYSKTFKDFEKEGLSIERSYNSRSLYNGLFGFGWCSNMETRLDTLPDGSIKSVECGGGMEIIYFPKNKVPNVNLYVKHILRGVKKKKPLLSEKKLATLKKDLLESENLRAAFMESLDIKGKTPQAGIKHYAEGRFGEYIIPNSKGYIRYLPIGVKETFNREGLLVKSSNSQGHIEIEWKPNKIQVMDQRGRRLIFYLGKKGGKIKKAVFGSKVVASYKHDGEDLIEARNNYGETYKYKYDSLHNLTKITYPDKTYEGLTYNVKKDWVTGFRDRRACQESYDYGVNKKNPNHYFSLVQKQCGRKIVHKSKYEFWHRLSPGGGKYLHRARVKVNDRLKTDVVYHPVFGVPVSFFKNGIRTKRSYYNNGFLKEKSNRYQKVRFSKYSQKCKKPEQVDIGYKDVSPKKRGKIVRQERIIITLDGKCQLVQAKKSADEWVQVRHNSKGRIVFMEDQSRKKITLTWHKTLNKPKRITRAGVGSIDIVYNADGSIKDMKGFQKPSVTAQVTSVFNSFFKTLSPIAEEMAIL